VDTAGVPQSLVGGDGIDHVHGAGDVAVVAVESGGFVTAPGRIGDGPVERHLEPIERRFFEIRKRFSSYRIPVKVLRAMTIRWIWLVPS
jgi:hypothetical protein